MNTACKTGCSGACNQGRIDCEHQPREAANQPRARLGSVGRRQCWLIKHGGTVALVIALVGAVVWGWVR